MSKLGPLLREYLMPLAMISLAGVVAYDHFRPTAHPDAPAIADGKALGRSFAPTVVPDLASAWLAAADALEQGKGMGDAQAALQSAWQAARIRSFTAKVAPGFAAVLPEGTEPTDSAKRAEVVKLWREFASGLKGGK